MERTNIPQIRFKDFDEEWEEKKLGEMGTTYNGLSGKTKEDFGHGKGKFITYMNVFSNSISNIDMTDSIEIDHNQNSVKYGDVFFTVSSETPNEVGMSSVYVNNEENIYLNSFCFGYRPYTKQNYNPYFFAYLLRSNTFRNKIILLAQGISRYNISKKKVMEIGIIKPQKDKEQTKIASLFTSLDKQISTSEAKLDKLRTIKKTLLKKMFASQGEKTPQIRFKGFEGEWEENALNNWIEPSKEKNIENKYSKNDVLSVSGDYGVVNQIEFQGRSFAGVSVSNYGVLHTNDIVYTKSPLKANPYGIIKTNMGQTGIVSTLYAIYRGKQNIDPIFVQHYFELDTRLNTYLRPLVRKGAKNDMKVSSEDAIKGNVNFPEKKEQTKISQLLLTFDKQILIQEQKIEKLKAIKKTLLKKMFV